jgi:hypothetical protein
MRISKLLEWPRDKIFINPQLTREIFQAFPKQSIYLFSTGSKRHMNRSAASNRLKKEALKIIHKRISAESFRFVYGK